MKFELEDTTILVTGSTGGIGPSLTDRLGKFVSHLVGTYRNEEELDEARDRAKRDQAVDYYSLDLTDEKQLLFFKDRLSNQNIEIDGIVNLVGGYSRSSLRDSSPQLLKNSFERQVTTCYLAIKTFADVLESHRGSVVNFSSATALQAEAGQLAYNIAKAGVSTLTRSIAKEFDQARCNAIAPLIMDTPANRQAMPEADTSTWVEPEEVADVTAFLLSERSQALNGQIFHL